MFCRSRVFYLAKITNFRYKICLTERTMSQDESFKADLKKRLSPIQYHVTQEKGTER